MKRDFYTKFGIIMAGLFVVPLFTLTVQATYLDIDGDITVDISGSIDKPVNEYKLFVPEVSLTYHETGGYIIGTSEVYKEVSGVILKDNASIQSQIDGKYNNYLSNFVFDNAYFEYMPSENKFDKEKTDFSVNPTSNIYLKYIGYYAKGSSQTGSLPMNYDTNTNTFLVNDGLVGSNLEIHKKIAGTTDIGNSIYTEWSSSFSGKYTGTYDCKNNISNFKRQVYLKPGVWAQQKWYEKTTLHAWGTVTEDCNPIGKVTENSTEYWLFEVDNIGLDDFVIYRNDGENKFNDMKFSTSNYSNTSYKIEVPKWGVNDGSFK